MVETAVRSGEVEWATTRLDAARQAEPRRTAIRLWNELAETRGAVRAGQDDRSDPGAYRRAIERVAAGEPIQYVTGVAGFRRLTLAADRRALIPRPETEGLVELALAAMPEGRALDLGTGSGCLALALADEGRYADVTGIDVCPDALVLARENGGRLGLAVRWLVGSWCEPIRGERFDVIVTNPPYIADSERSGLERSVRDWEPRAALDGGPDGLRAAEAVLRQGGAVLAPEGWLFMEVDASRAGATAALATGRGWRGVTIGNDLFGRPRYLAARRGAEG